MEFVIITIFPQFVEQVFSWGILRRAVESGKVSYRLVDPREFATDKHKSVDDVAYGGRPGMVMMCEPIFRAMEALAAEGALRPNRRFIHLTPTGRLLDWELAKELAGNDQLVLLVGRYEGIDQRVIEAFADEEISLGDYVLSGGELAAMVLVDAIARFVPEVVGNEQSVIQDSFSSGLLDHVHYTRPAEFRGMKVPEVLLSGNHAEIEKWRREQAEQLTRQRRPDLWERYVSGLSAGDGEK
ncbi:MAG: tRNA (guanosine(37)-N1)-methyltransferase TrmD [Candidatus Riflebacteria bacterium RBG_13_59_9]|nr:MAG: tRNA (guanosine(37)-N1)-methyltransferase TrmD [Candidatus Riflebacteria bacterium RBG_13_59_9]